MSVFADSSALVKLYVPEAGHEQVRAIAAPIVISSLARVELPAAFWGKHRSGEIEADDAALLSDAFAFDYHGDDEIDPTFAIVPVTEAVLIEAARHAARHRLRAYDAVQLASAVLVRTVDPSVNSIAVFDKLLRAGAVAEGFAIIGS